MLGFFGKTFYHMSIIPLVLLTTLLAWHARPATTEQIPTGFRRFQLCYLLVWAFCVASDWLQGPYVYALYSEYNFSRQEIAELFVAGFCASLVFGAVVGTVCDKYGRKNCALAYCVLYIVSCLTKHVKNYSALMFGRVTGGIATSLLFSCFECWMVSEHQSRHKFSSGLLSYMFGMMFTTMYLVAIVSGMVGEVLAEAAPLTPVAAHSSIHWGGALGPFDLAIVCLLVGAVLIIFLWEENYGQEPPDHDSRAQSESSMISNFTESLQMCINNKRMWLVGLVVATFEGSMYAFVFNWTPALQSDVVPPPYGLIFALFMMACMSGAAVSTMTDQMMTPCTRLALAFAAGAIALCVAATFSGNLTLSFFAFMVFEFCVGMYFPSIGIVKSEVVPERVRGTMYNIYRVPLNAVVVALLLTNMSIVRIYELCALLLGVAFIGILAIMSTPGPLSDDTKTVKNV